MKSALSLALVVCLLSSAIPAAAEDRIHRSPGPIGRTIERQAFRLQPTDGPDISGGESAQQRHGIHTHTPDQAYGVVMDLGVGQHVAVTLRSGKTVRGHIHQVAADRFTLLLDGQADPADIAYRNVRQLVLIPFVQRAWRWQSVEKAIGIAGAIAFFGLAITECRNKSC